MISARFNGGRVTMTAQLVERFSLENMCLHDAATADTDSRRSSKVIVNDNVQNLAPHVEDISTNWLLLTISNIYKDNVASVNMNEFQFQQVHQLLCKHGLSGVAEYKRNYFAYTTITLPIELTPQHQEKYKIPLKGYISPMLPVIPIQFFFTVALRNLQQTQREQKCNYRKILDLSYRCCDQISTEGTFFLSLCLILRYLRSGHENRVVSVQKIWFTSVILKNTKSCKTFDISLMVFNFFPVLALKN